MGYRLRLAAAAVFSLLVAGCASNPDRFGSGIAVTGPNDGRIVTPSHFLECVPYARNRSGVAIYGDAATWWRQAAGRYARETAPVPGSVMVLDGYAGFDRAHLGVVSGIMSNRQIRIDHANWLNDGAVYVGDPVADVSADNDWSQVRVYNLRTRSWGARTYPVQGFIGPGSGRDSLRVAASP